MLSGDVYLDFGRPPKWNCPIPEGDATADASSTGEVSSYEASPTKVRSPPQVSCIGHLFYLYPIVMHCDFRDVLLPLELGGTLNAPCCQRYLRNLKI